jgi:hypothetical protein
LGDGHTSDLKHDSFVCLAVEIDRIAIIHNAPRGPKGAPPFALRWRHYIA